MKNLAKLLTMALLVGLFGVVAISSLLATPSVQTPLVATTSYNVETGIRWNEGFKVFEVYNANGISYIASGEYFDAGGIKGTSTDTGMVRADGTKTYYIMQDIAYNPADINNLETAFAGGARHSITTGAVNGRGFILKNFPVVATASAGSALFRSNGGTIQNIILENPVYTEGTANTGILVYENTGVIDGCEVLGTINTANVISMAAIAYIGNGTIRNCTNYANITTAGTRLAGIFVESDSDTATVFNCSNYGDIKNGTTVGNVAGGIAAYKRGGKTQNNMNYGSISSYDAGGILGGCGVAAVVNGNKNFGSVSGTSSAYGIIGGVISATVETNANENFAKQIGTETMLELFNKVVRTDGIKWVADGYFVVSDIIGFSYIASEQYITTTGEIDSDGTNGGSRATSDATYYIIEDIKYIDSDELFTKNPISPSGAIKIYGRLNGEENRAVNLSNFPIREGNAGEYSALFGTLSAGAEIRGLNLFTNAIDVDGNTGVLFYGGSASITNCTVNGTINSTKGFSIGAFSYSGNGTFNACTNQMDIVTKGQSAAGFVAKATGSTTFVDCVNKGDIQTQGVVGEAAASGFVAVGGSATTLDFERCINDGSVLASSLDASNDAGGIVGSFSGTSLVVKESKNTGRIRAISGSVGTNSAASAGGIVAKATTHSILYACENTDTASIEGSGGGSFGAWVGGIAGYLAGSNVVNNVTLGELELSEIGTYVIYPKNRGSIEILSDATSDANKNNSIGGVVGYVDINAARLTVLGKDKDSSLGENQDIEYENDVLGGLWANNFKGVTMGGIVGLANFTGSALPDSVTRLDIKNCTNNSPINNTCNRGSHTTAGGILGDTRGIPTVISIADCINKGTISADAFLTGNTTFGANVGGIVGAAYRDTEDTGASINVIIRDCINEASATISGKSSDRVGAYVGGIAGRLATSTSSNKDVYESEPFDRVGSLILRCENGADLYALYNGNPSVGTSFNCVGGIVGYITLRNSSSFTIEECTNEGGWIDAGVNCNYVGGIVGGLFSAGASVPGTVNFIRCTNNRSITAKSTIINAGGMLGRLSAAAYTVKAEDCISNGAITIPTSSGYFAGRTDLTDISGLTLEGTTKVTNPDAVGVRS